MSNTGTFKKHFCAGDRPCKIEAELQLVGTDLVVTVYGGIRPHVGAVAVAIPRPSLSQPGGVSANTSIFSFSGHKEDEIAREMAQKISAGLNRKVVLTAGMHWAKVDPGILAAVRENSRALAGMIIESVECCRGCSGADG